MKVGKIINSGEDLKINLEKLVATRLLIQSNSGGGKSWLGRKIIEGFSGKIQQIIIDIEGEFSTLREKFDFLLVGKGGEIPANINTAELLAKRLLELNVSTIIDLSELKHPERITFVKRFLDSLINSPQELWHPVLVYIDEAHQFAPEGKSGKAESKSAVIDLMTRGRKRGFSGILMTQRISKLDKDACAEANNKFIGRATLDIDRKRASEELGFTSKEDERSLRDLEAGEFYAFGSAFSELGINKIKVGSVETTHPDRTKGIKIKPSSTPENIKKLLKNIIDLPKEAQQDFKDKDEMRREITRLRTELTKVNNPKPNISREDIEKARAEGMNIQFNKDNKEYSKSINLEVSKVKKEFEKQFNEVLSKLKFLKDKMSQINKITCEVPINYVDNIKLDMSKIEIAKVGIEPKPLPHGGSIQPIHHNRLKNREGEVLKYSENGEPIKLSLCSKRIYSFLYQNQDREFSIHQLAFATGYKPSGSFTNSIYELTALNLIKKSGRMISISDVDESFVTEESMKFSPELIEKNLSKCAKTIFRKLFDNPNDEFILDEEFAQDLGYSLSGSFTNSIYELTAIKSIIKDKNIIRLNPEVLEL